MAIFLSQVTCLSMKKHKKSMTKESERHSKSLMKQVQPLIWRSANSLREVKFAGHMISKDGIKSDPEKVESVQGMATPQNVSDVRQSIWKIRFQPSRENKTTERSPQ